VETGRTFTAYRYVVIQVLLLRPDIHQLLVSLLSSTLDPSAQRCYDFLRVRNAPKDTPLCRNHPESSFVKVVKKRRTRVRDGNAVKASVIGFSHCRMHTYFRCHTTDNQLLNSLRR
jgi:hypothetical protein